MRRVVAALLLAAATLVSGLLAAPAATASPWPPQPTAPTQSVPAAPTAPVPDPGDPRSPSRNPLDRLGDSATGAGADLQCKRPPPPGKPDEGLAGWVDGGPAQRGSGLYSTYGYGGWQPVIYDPGCPVSIDGLRGAQARIFDGRNETASLYVQAQLAAVALAVEAADIVFAQDGIWALLTPVTAFLRWSVGARWWVLFGALALAATGIYWLVRARRGDVAEASASSARSAVILAVGGACLATTVTAGALVSQGVSAFYGAMSEATAQSAEAVPGGGNAGRSPAPAPGTADAVLGDMLMQNVVYPSWAMVHFGNDGRAAEQFGQRLFAASAMTRDESARAAQDPAYASSLTATKKADYVRVAAEYQAAFPDTYDRYLAGNDTSGRPSAALAGLLACIPIAVFLVWSLWWMGTLRIVVDLALALAPAGALLAQFPKAQWLATSLVRWLTVYLVTAAVATTLFVVLVAGGVGGILGANAATSSKVIAMFVLLLLARAAWKRRRLLTDRTGVSRDSERVAVALDSLRQEYRDARGRRAQAVTGEAVPVAASVAGAARGESAAAVSPIALADAEPRRLERPGSASGVDSEAESAGTGSGVAVTERRDSVSAEAAGPAAALGTGSGGVAFDSFDEAARQRAAQRIAAARAASRPGAAETGTTDTGAPADQGDVRSDLERPRRLDPIDWPTDRHEPQVAEVPDSWGAFDAADERGARRLEEQPVAVRVTQEVNVHADTARK